MLRRSLLLTLVCLLAACHGRGESDAFTDSRIPPNLGPAYWPPQGWAWGLIQVGDNAPQRYGVGAPMDQTAGGAILYLPGYGGLSEEYFQTASTLIDQRMEVWTLDGVGQGGSGRLTPQRDLGHVDSFDGDIAGVEQMIAGVIRPDERTPLVAIADGTAAPVLLRVLERRSVTLAGVILTEPRLSPPGRTRVPQRSAADAASARWLRYGAYRAPGAEAWKREGAVGAPGTVGYVRHAWQTANPDLRMGGPSLGWISAFEELVTAVKSSLGRVEAPVLVLSDPATPSAIRREESALCRALPHCTLRLLAQTDWPEAEASFLSPSGHELAAPLRVGALPKPDRRR